MQTIRHFTRFEDEGPMSWGEEQNFILNEGYNTSQFYQRLIRRQAIYAPYNKHSYILEYTLVRGTVAEIGRFRKGMLELTGNKSLTKGHFSLGFATLYEAMNFIETNLERIKLIVWRSTLPAW